MIDMTIDAVRRAVLATASILIALGVSGIILLAIGRVLFGLTEDDVIEEGEGHGN